MKTKLLLLLSSAFLLVGCGQTPVEEKVERSSSLRGTFTYNTSMKIKYKHEIQDADYLFCTKFPEKLLAEDVEILYQIDQRLKLNKDYTYSYSFNVILGNPGDWGSLEFAKLHVDIKGTYEYYDLGNNKYSVALSNATSGTEEIYSYHMTSFDPNNTWWLYSVSRHTDVDYKIDIATLGDNMQYDAFTQSKSVIVTKANDAGESNVIKDIRVYRNIFDVFAKYSTY